MSCMFELNEYIFYSKYMLNRILLVYMKSFLTKTKYFKDVITSEGETDICLLFQSQTTNVNKWLKLNSSIFRLYYISTLETIPRDNFGVSNPPNFV